MQKATELGVCEIGVFESRYCSAYMNENKLARLQKVAREAAQQCLRATVPAVRYFPSLGEALAAAQGYENRLFACEFAEKSDADLRALKGSCALVVGSEGGFAPRSSRRRRRRALRASRSANASCAPKRRASRSPRR